MYYLFLMLRLQYNFKPLLYKINVVLKAQWKQGRLCEKYFNWLLAVIKLLKYYARSVCTGKPIENWNILKLFYKCKGCTCYWCIGEITHLGSWRTLEKLFFFHFYYASTPITTAVHICVTMARLELVTFFTISILMSSDLGVLLHPAAKKYIFFQINKNVYFWLLNASDIKRKHQYFINDNKSGLSRSNTWKPHKPFNKPAKNGHIPSSAEAKSTADLEIKVQSCDSKVNIIQN